MSGWNPDRGDNGATATPRFRPSPCYVVAKFVKFWTFFVGGLFFIPKSHPLDCRGISLKSLLQVGLVGVFLGAFSGCGKKDGASANEQVLRISQRNEPADLDPATISFLDELFIIRALSEGLVVPSDNGGQLPAAAERWTVSDDGLLYTFRLRQGARWSNGEVVTSDDFIASWQRALTPATAGPKVAVFFGVKNARAFFSGKITNFKEVGFRAVEPDLIAITLEQPNPSFLAYVASGPWIPTNPRVVAKFSRNWTKPANFVGNGPFVLTEWRPHQRIVVRKNPLYVDAAQIKLSEIDFLAFDSGETEERAFRTGQVDVTMSVPISKIPGYLREHSAEFRQTPLAETRYLSFNTQRTPLNDARVRRALSLVIDREKITSKVTLSGDPATDFIAPALLSLRTAKPAIAKGKKVLPSVVTMTDSATREKNLTLARDLMTAAGFPGGRGFPRFEVTCWSSGQTSTLEAIQAMWKTELGVDVTLAQREYKVHFTALRTGNFDISYTTAIPDVADPIEIPAYLVSDSTNNHSFWSNPAYDALVAQMRQASNSVSQQPFMTEAEQILHTEAPIAPLFYNVKNWLISPRVHGWHEDALWNRSYRDVTITPK